LPQRANAITAVQLHHTWLCNSDPPRELAEILSSLRQLRRLDIIFNREQSWSPRKSQDWLLGLIPLLRDEVSVTVVLKPSTPELLGALEACDKPNLRILEAPESEVFR
jgi:hypothetical protein